MSFSSKDTSVKNRSKIKLYQWQAKSCILVSYFYCRNKKGVRLGVAVNTGIIRSQVNGWLMVCGFDYRCRRTRPDCYNFVERIHARTRIQKMWLARNFKGKNVRNFERIQISLLSCTYVCILFAMQLGNQWDWSTDETRSSGTHVNLLHYVNN